MSSGLPVRKVQPAARGEHVRLNSVTPEAFATDDYQKRSSRFPNFFFARSTSAPSGRRAHVA